ncbi:DUF2786 domain-containing protein [Acinetobacter baumannii]|uniref:DUF2786 domain-containing protein n=1 Tax=Acinetobacter baumannii TaxID=470 RepID=UPI000D13431E|nr:DUF2786 domain-containing protein [Acinetobacter baumannii]HDU8195779.1 DUF2786 domain-containing protein [Acinetobacter baumannii]HDU8199165.1 DUF2786 domain-containing protein [Acinetobacter baumannii]
MDEAVLRKIKRCFELSKSSNEHEAALAIKQMQALMQKHGLNQKHVLAADCVENACVIDAKKKPAQWVLSLHATIAQALDCGSMVRHWGGVKNIRLIFIGIGSAPEIASYAFEVLYRKLKKNRAEYIDEYLWRYKRANKTKLADAYCTGWVSNVYSKVKNLNPNLEIKEQVEAYKETKIKGFDPEKVFNGNQRFDKRERMVQGAMNDGYSEAKEVNLFVAAEHKESLQIGERA